MIELEKGPNPGHFQLTCLPLKDSHNVTVHKMAKVTDADGKMVNDLTDLMALLNKNKYILVETGRNGQFIIQTEYIVTAANGYPG
jgi:hypothetical protein